MERGSDRTYVSYGPLSTTGTIKALSANEFLIGDKKASSICTGKKGQAINSLSTKMVNPIIHVIFPEVIEMRECS
jgi:hypothetical protein